VLSRCLVTGLSVLFIANGRAEIPEPDNVLYGTITLDGSPVTAARTDVVVEARRLTNGPAIASYRMGSNPELGSFYSLRVRLESLAPVLDTNASPAGANLFIVVRDTSGARQQAGYTVGERGQIQRLDFGAAIPDSDGDGLPDAWEIQYYGNLNQNGGSIGANGRTLLENFIAGSAPNDTNTLFKLSVSASGGQRFVSFVARRAEGVGYEGRSRFYTLESSTNVTQGPWTGITGFINILGNNQTVTYQAPVTNTRAFHRGRVSLTEP
jgi:hypothetical protein